jgi:hypothetical protein
MKSRAGLMTVAMTIAVASSVVSILARPACAAPGEDTEEPGNPTPPSETAPSPPPAAAVAAASEPLAPRRRPNDLVWGVGLRARYVSVPGWLLGQFIKHNVPLGTFGHYGIEGFRRTANFQVTLAFSYQNMSPPDGNWLANGHDPMIDTRLLQFRGLSLYSFDAAVSWQGMISPWFGLHAGAGLGLAVVHGSLYVSNSQGCTDANIGDLSQCHPPGFICANGVCTHGPGLTLKANGDVLPVFPVVNVFAGMDFRLPEYAKGWEAKIEGGFFDAFFLGLGVGYTF